MKKSKFIVLGLGLAMACAVMFAGASNVKADSQTKINDGVYIGSVNVGGMTSTEAKDAVSAYVNSLMNTTFTLNGANGSMEASAEQMGVTADIDTAVEEALAVGNTGNLINRFKETTDLKSQSIVISMHLEVDKQATAQLIYDKSSALNVAAEDNGLTRQSGGFVFVPGKEGQEVNIVNSVYAINDFLSTKWDGMSTEIDLVVDTVEPRGSQEELAKVKDVLGTFSTNFGSSAYGRAQNVKNGCAKINGSIVYPGEEFSVYKTVSPFTQENGYELAGSYSNGTTVETFGGGICQVSTTLYNAVIKAELEVSMRFNHSMIVNYVNPSQDAAISGEYKDFRFINNTNTPIYIEGACNGGILSFTVYGEETRPANRTVTFESETLKTEEPETKFNMSGDFEVGYYAKEQSAHKGIVAKLWKIVTVDGVQESRTEFNSSTYKASPKIIVVGVKGANADQRAKIKAACNSKDESKVKAAIAAVKEEIKQKEDEKKNKDKEEENDNNNNDNNNDNNDNNNNNNDNNNNNNNNNNNDNDNNNNNNNDNGNNDGGNAGDSTTPDNGGEAVPEDPNAGEVTQ